MRAVAFVLFSFLVVGVSGCKNCDLVEAELRSKDRDLRQLRDELRRIEMCNDGLHREIRAMRRNSPARVPPEDATLIFSLKNITLGRQTGGYDDDDCSGDEALQVVLEPRDVDNHLIKAPGMLVVQALEVNKEGLKKPLCSWQVGNEQLRRTWKNGLLSTGYFVILPWKCWPESEKLRVVVHFTLADGRSFEADKDVSVRLTPQARRKPSPPEAEPAPQPRPLPSPGPALEQTSLSGAVKMLPPRPRR